MLNDATGFQKVFIITGRTDLRYGIDRLAATVEAMSGEKPLVPNTLYLFCGSRSDRIKGLVWERLSADFCYPHIFKLNPSNRRFSEKFPVETMRIKI